MASYPPQGESPAESMRIGTARPPITPGQAALLTLLARYGRLSQLEEPVTPQGASLLEIHNLTYFLQEAGQHLQLNYARAPYGPYAANLNPVLQALDGHYLHGYGDRAQEVLKLSPISLLPGAEESGRRWLDAHADGTSGRIDAVLSLITGFASPYGLELLATVHWVLSRGDDELADPDDAVRSVGAWNAHRGRLFTDVHIRRAADRLRDQQWVAGQQAVPSS